MHSRNDQMILNTLTVFIKSLEQLMHCIWFIRFRYLILLWLLCNQMNPDSCIRLIHFDWPEQFLSEIHIYDNKIADCVKQYCTAWDCVNWVIQCDTNKWEEAVLIWTMGHTRCDQSAQRMCINMKSVLYSDLFNQKIVEVSSVTKSIYFSHLVFFFPCLSYCVSFFHHFLSVWVFNSLYLRLFAVRLISV